MTYSNGKQGSARFVSEMLRNLELDSASITITPPEKLGGRSAITAIIVSSDGTETVHCLDAWPNTLILELVGLFLKYEEYQKEKGNQAVE